MLIKVTEVCNGKKTITDVYANRELAEKRTKSTILSFHYGENAKVQDKYTYIIEEMETETEPFFDVYIMSSKHSYTNGRRISDMTFEEAMETYNKFSKDYYVELQLPQKQFGFTLCGITKVINNLDEKYYAMKEAYREEQERLEETKCYSPSNPWDAPGMSISDFI